MRQMIQKEDLCGLVAGSVLFQELEAEACQTVIDAGRIYPLTQGQILFHQGDLADVFYIVLDGYVKLTKLNYDGHQITVSYVGPGGGIGIIVALSQTEYPVSGEVVQDGEVIAWGGDSMQELMLRYPRLALNGMKLIAEYFVHLQSRYHELSTERVEQRVARALMRLVRQTGRKVKKGILIDMPLSRQDLAEMTGTTLFTISRILKGWEQKGFVLPERERVTIIQPHELVVIAEDLPAGHKLDLQIDGDD